VKLKQLSRFEHHRHVIEASYQGSKKITCHLDLDLHTDHHNPLYVYLQHTTSRARNMGEAFTSYRAFKRDNLEVAYPAYLVVLRNLAS
jgi:hypothetical protein